MRFIRRHLSYANVMVTILAFIVLTGGTAVALSGSNTVQSDDIGPGAQVKAADIAANAVAAPAWRQIGAAGQPAFHTTNSCKWRNFDSVHSTAAFTRDPAGFVHLRGTVAAEDRGAVDACHTGSGPNNQMIFQLPSGYRPQRRDVMAIVAGLSSGPTAGTLGIDGPPLNSLPAGAVSVDPAQIGGSPSPYFTLDGISFRCEPSGSNGCP